MPKSKTSLAAGVKGTPQLARPREEYSALFLKGQNDFSGADGDLSIPIGKGRSLWLFGDTLIGPRLDAGHLVRNMPRNAVGILRKDRNGSLDFQYYWRSEKGRPKSFFAPARGGEWLWPGSACGFNGKLFFFLRRIRTRHRGGSEGFNFQTLGPSIYYTENPNDPPDLWQLRSFEPTMARSVVWCSACYAERDGQVYLWGMTNGRRKKGTVAARCSLADLEKEKGDRWEYWCRRGGQGIWTRETSDLLPLFEDAPSEISVSYLRRQKLYLIVYGTFETGDVGFRTAPSIMGPWSPYRVAYNPPEMDWCKDYFCYSPKAHPEIETGDGELLITYITNAHKIKYLVEDPRIYNPRFISIPYEVLDGQE